MEIVENVDIEFFVIDEFYKIQPTPTDQERSIILNQAFYKLLKKGGQFYLLGPNIENINATVFPQNMEFKFMKTDYKTVVTEVSRVLVTNSQEDALLNLCVKLNEPTLIYCASPKSANRIAKLLFESGKFVNNNQNNNAVNWLKQEYHPDWYLPRALTFGIGIHHGRIPRAISQYAVKAFNDDKLSFLICTSTLIEGVNTKAKNVIIYDNRIAREEFDFFTFNNICGRSGRMFQHFIGRVYLFHEPPQPELPIVDFPLFSQTEDVPDKLLLQMDRNDLSEQSQEKIKSIYQNEYLSISTLKVNGNIEPHDQIALAQYITNNIQLCHMELKWRSFPTYNQLKFACELIWDFFIGSPRLGNISSGSQLAYKINILRTVRNIKDLIEREIPVGEDEERINEAIENVMDFVRYWAQYNFPKYLLALQRIQEEVFNSHNLAPGDYSFFATQIECLFTDPLFVALDEYGMPLQTADKIKDRLQSDNLDDLLSKVKNLNVESLPLSDFEKELIQDIKTYV